VSSLFAILGTMGESMLAQQAGLDVTGQNVANVNTPGYVEQTAQLETQAPEGGVVVGGVTNAFDQFTFAQVVRQSGLSGAANSRSEALNSAQQALAPQGGGDIGSAMTAFFSAYSALSASPSDPSARAAVLSQATTLAQSISGASNGLGQQQESLLTQAQGVSTELNQDLSQIAQLNSEIAQSSAEGDQAPGLRDQQNALVAKVATDVGGQAVYDSSGSVTILAAGTALVSAGNASTVAVGLDSTGALKITAAQGNGFAMDITRGVTEGTLGGIREARDTDIASSMSQLDQFAYSLANAVNGVQSTGYGLDGATGRPLFTPPTQIAGAASTFAVGAAIAGNPDAIAASSTAGGLPGGNDAALAMAQLATQALGSNGTPASSYATITAHLGGAASQASADASTRTDTLTQAQNLDSSQSGVSLAQENVNLTRFQQAFQASSQVLQVTDSLLTNLMTMMTNVGA
jgi:flagellar hook-associated protein 1 FlgK